ncbi:hypothetical protein [Curtobacterium luteum]|uniref:Uncharacterized protein n=1 Tax=Curtobacterium luteum TaxID=33881 RepID=A0A175S0B1_9MICO|nr:hypothetical protein [Curtobacterium luteum]KTR09094.1 hypothetical protein NS184_03685 [Curtobacterium luteum]
MTTGDPRSRPTVVTAAVVLWLVVFAVQTVAHTVRIGAEARGFGPWSVVPIVLGFAVLGFFAFGALRLARGSGRARFWLAVLGAVSLIGSFAPPYGLTTAEGIASTIAAVLPYLPGARGWFPPRVRRVSRPAQPRVVGWDPETGEPIRASE